MKAASARVEKLRDLFDEALKRPYYPLFSFSISRLPYGPLCKMGPLFFLSFLRRVFFMWALFPLKKSELSVVIRMIISHIKIIS